MSDTNIRLLEVLKAEAAAAEAAVAHIEIEIERLTCQTKDAKMVGRHGTQHGASE
ncbi:hypothetical protein [Breoghania sp. L-A4]|uniref:hypothetical protein n=1 Tax=Breoghania sp. L-A4 TaxID=2304600 RepID=UPI0013C3394A|nr:hypothetical protein [Breoghania sp. L-A4]